MTGEERDAYIEMWKQTIDVQKHFNDIELRIRGLALTVLTFVLGGASLAIRDGTKIRLYWFDLQMGTLILAFGTLLWLTFYFVDQVWYHRLLIGAVVHGQELERELRKVLPIAGLTHRISENSPYLVKISIAKKVLWQYEIHSNQKISFFYWFVAILLIIVALAFQLVVQPAPSAVKSPRPTVSIMHREAYAKLSLKKYSPIAARNEDEKVFNGLR